MKRFILIAVLGLMALPMAADTLSTYTASFSVVCGGAGDCVTLFPPSSGIARVREVWVSKPSTAITVSIIKRSSADSGGTPGVLTAAKLDSADPSAGSTALAYTAAPTPGTTAATLLTQALGTSETMVKAFGATNDKPLMLRGTSTEGLAISVSTGATISGYIEWTE